VQERTVRRGRKGFIRTDIAVRAYRTGNAILRSVIYGRGRADGIVAGVNGGGGCQQFHCLSWTAIVIQPTQQWGAV